jgi:hypothetical protein
MNSRVGHKTTLQLEKMLKEYIDTKIRVDENTGKKYYVGDLTTYQNLVAYNQGAKK